MQPDTGPALAEPAGSPDAPHREGTGAAPGPRGAQESTFRKEARLEEE